MIPDLNQWVKDPAMSCGVGHRCGSDLVLLWLWCRPAAIAPIGCLAWGPPYASGAALKTPKKKKKKKINSCKCLKKKKRDGMHPYLLLSSNHLLLGGPLETPPLHRIVPSAKTSSSPSLRTLGSKTAPLGYKSRSFTY